MTTTGKILVVDEDCDMREFLHVLEHAGYAVISAIDGVDALARMRSEDCTPSVVLLDMPTKNGMQFLAEIKRSDTRAHIPVVAVSYDAQSCARSSDGATASLAVPFQMHELLGTVAQVVATKR